MFLPLLVSSGGHAEQPASTKGKCTLPRQEHQTELVAHQEFNYHCYIQLQPFQPPPPRIELYGCPLSTRTCKECTGRWMVQPALWRAERSFFWGHTKGFKMLPHLRLLGTQYIFTHDIQCLDLLLLKKSQVAVIYITPLHRQRENSRAYIKKKKKGAFYFNSL